MPQSMRMARAAGISEADKIEHTPMSFSHRQPTESTTKYTDVSLYDRHESIALSPVAPRFSISRLFSGVRYCFFDAGGEWGTRTLTQRALYRFFGFWAPILPSSP